MGTPLPRVFKQRDLKKLLGEHGCAWAKTGNSGSHHIEIDRIHDGQTLSYRLPDSDEYFKTYIKALRKSLKLDAKNNVDDYKFMNPKHSTLGQ